MASVARARRLRRQAAVRNRGHLPSRHDANQELRSIEHMLVHDGTPPDVLELVAAPHVLVCARQRVFRNDVGNTRRSRAQGLHLEAIRVASLSDLELIDLGEELSSGAFQWQPVTWRRRRGKDYAIACTRDKVAATALSTILGAAWIPLRHGGAWGIGPERGTLATTEMLTRNLPWFLDRRDGWVLRADVKECFEHLRYDAVLKRLATFVSDPDILTLVAGFLRAVESAPGVGVGRGTVLGPLLANIALSAIDVEYPEIGDRFTAIRGIPVLASEALPGGCEQSVQSVADSGIFWHLFQSSDLIRAYNRSVGARNIRSRNRPNSAPGAAQTSTSGGRTEKNHSRRGKESP
jgi:hypothetical protein